jgi:3-oxoacyl-[acyl-carrier-protein] synthase II
MTSLLRPRVVITGVGVVCPVGTGKDQVWASLLAGRSGVARITLFDPSPYPIQFAGEVKGFDPSYLAPAKELRRMDRVSLLTLAAARQAVEDAGLHPADLTEETTGVFIGSAAGGFQQLLEQHQVLLERGPRRVSPFFIQNMLVDSPAGHVAIALGLRGPNMAAVSACATGTQAIGEAAHVIARGDAEVMLAGGAETPIHPVILSGFAVMHALGGSNEAPERASCPFTLDRNGFVLSEGAAVVVLETLERAQARGAFIYAEVAGSAASCDAYDMAAAPEDGMYAARCMRKALRNANLQPEDIDYINAHGTSTPLNDKAETEAIKQVFGDYAYNLAVSSTKSMTGHMMGASGAVETVICALALRDQLIPPTINYDRPDPACDLDYVPHRSRATRVRAALSNSFGLGGHNATLVLRLP